MKCPVPANYGIIVFLRVELTWIRYQQVLELMIMGMPPHCFLICVCLCVLYT